MEIRLSPEMAAMVERDMVRGGYGSAEEYVADAIELMHEQEEWFGETLEEERAKMETSLAEARRGDVFTEDEVREYMLKVKQLGLVQDLNGNPSESGGGCRLGPYREDVTKLRNTATSR